MDITSNYGRQSINFHLRFHLHVRHLWDEFWSKGSPAAVRGRSSTGADAGGGSCRIQHLMIVSAIKIHDNLLFTGNYHHPEALLTWRSYIWWNMMDHEFWWMIQTLPIMHKMWWRLPTYLQSSPDSHKDRVLPLSPVDKCVCHASLMVFPGTLAKGQGRCLFLRN